jgi:hypothetical protein
MTVGAGFVNNGDAEAQRTPQAESDRVVEQDLSGYETEESILGSAVASPGFPEQPFLGVKGTSLVVLVVRSPKVYPCESCNVPRLGDRPAPAPAHGLNPDFV